MSLAARDRPSVGVSGCEVALADFSGHDCGVTSTTNDSNGSVWCFQCGNEYDEDVAECPECGVPTTSEAPLDVATVLPDGAPCLDCHGASAYRPAEFPQVVEADHAMGEACDGCHDAHRPGFD